MYIVKTVSYQGSRESNEDVVSDGVGSYANADKATQYVAEFICNKNNSNLSELIREYHDYLVNNHDKYGYTTVDAIEQVGESFVCCNVGDTRIYVFGKKTFAEISKDHTN